MRNHRCFRHSSLTPGVLSVIVYTQKRGANPEKTKVLHIGPDNPRRGYSIDNRDILATDLQKDIGFLIPENLSTSNHIQNARSRAFMEKGIIKRTFDYVDKRLP